MEAKKNDSGKIPLQIVPPRAMLELAKAFQHGAKKYGLHNFMLGTGFSHLRLLGAALRHINAHIRGEDIDEESGNTHLSHAMAALAMLIELIQSKQPLEDDRWKPPQCTSTPSPELPVSSQACCWDGPPGGDQP